MRARNWAETPLGPAAQWSLGIKTAVSICLGASHPILLWLGPELRIVYNDAYIPFLGDTKHPAMLGAPGREAWSEIWPVIGPMLDRVQAGQATLVEDLPMFFARRLPAEEVYVTFGYSPILAADGRVEGVFCPCTETTEKIIAARRISTLRDLGRPTADRRTSAAACIDAAQVLADNPFDMPFAAFYLRAGDNGHANRVAGTGLTDLALFPEVHPIGTGDGLTAGPWPLGTVAESRRRVVVSALPQSVGVLVAGPWSEPVERAFVLPLAAPGQAEPAGFLILGVSSRRVLDDDYRSFVDLVAGRVAARMADASAFDAERRRAEALAALDRAKTAFFSNISHEFRTPLTLMLSPLEDLAALPADALRADARPLVEMANRNALRLLRLVNTLLDFSRVEAGRLDARFEPVDLTRLTVELASTFESVFDRAGLTLVLDCPPLPDLVYVDRSMWEKIVLNLISNAFKFTFDGAVRVALTAGERDVRLTVSDTGTGIPEAELPRVFERFHRIEGQRGRSQEGSGIGLALVRDLVLAHRGEIAVDSAVGRGTTFAVTLPRGHAHLPAEQVGDPLPPAAATRAGAVAEEARQWLPDQAHAGIEAVVAAPASRPSAGAHVLVADDNADMRAYLSRLLGAAGYTVETVGDGLAALAAATERPPDLVVSDVMMPGLDGLALMAALRRDPRLLDVPAILLSARSGDEAYAAGLETGADDYLVKPFSARELLARVNAHLALAQQRRREHDAMVSLAKLSTRLTATTDLPGLYHEVLDAMIALHDGDFGNVQIFDRQTETLAIVAQRGFTWRFLEHFRTVAADEGSACGRALRDRRRLVVEDVHQDPEFASHRAIAAAAGFRAVVSTPLVEGSGGALIGMVSTHFRTVRRPSERQLRLSDLYARQAADMIALRNSDQQVRRSEARLQAAIDLVGLSPYVWDPVTWELSSDARLKAMWGLPADARVDRDMFLSAIHRADLPRVDAAITRSADPAGDGAYKTEYRVIGIEDRVERWISAQGRTFFQGGVAIEHIGAALDITDRKRADQRLRESEARLRQFANHSTDVLWVMDVESWDVAFLGASFERVWGLPIPRGWTREQWLATLHPEDREHAARALERVLGGDELVLRYRIVRPDGAVRSIRDTLFPIPDEHGIVRRIGGIAQDTTVYSGSVVYVISGNKESYRGLIDTLRGAGYEVNGFLSAQAFLNVAPALVAGCVVVDVRSAEAGGLVVPWELRSRRTQLPVIAVGDETADAGLGVRAMKAGAVDFLQESRDWETLVTAVATALAGIRATAEGDREAAFAHARIQDMSPRERQVFDRMLAGGTNKSMARELGLSPRTIEIHRARAMERLGVRTLSEAFVLAAAAGIIPLSTSEARGPAGRTGEAEGPARRGRRRD